MRWGEAFGEGLDMRLSADRKSVDWHPVANSVKVFLDGVEQTHCITADEERGNIIQYARDEDGKILMAENGEDALTVCIHGAVRIEVPDEHKHLLAKFPFGPMEALSTPSGAL
jgi:hypothetical protein